MQQRSAHIGRWLLSASPAAPLLRLKGVAPQVARVAIIYNPQTAPYAGSFLHSIETAGPVLAIQPIAIPIRDAGTIEKAIEAFAREINSSLLVLPDVTTTQPRSLPSGQLSVSAICPVDADPFTARL